MLVFFAFTAHDSTASAIARYTNGEKLITIHDRGQERSVITTKDTLREIFADQGTLLDKRDIVEPSLDEKLTAHDYQVNVYRARPVLVIDGKASVQAMTAGQTAKQIAKDAGLTLHDEDKTSMKLSTDVINDGASLEMNIQRATPFSFVFYGKTVQSFTMAKTVGEMLKDKGIVPAKGDTLSPGADALITANMSVQLWHNGKQTVTLDEDIPYTTRTINDPAQPIGYRQVQTAGENGKQTVTYQIDMRNGKEFSRNALEKLVSKQMTEEVIVVGTKVDLPPGSHEDWMAAAGISASDYGYVNYIVMREGGWEPCKVQGGAIDCSYGGSMGYGMVQATPGGKMVSAGADWRTNPITQLRWATGYANGRYGGWSGAYNHWLSSHNW